LEGEAGRQTRAAAKRDQKFAAFIYARMNAVN
jgi:hypothetical protein